VNTRDLIIRALGTEFNVKSYPDEDATETTLVSGIVEIAVTDEGIASRPVLLKPDQRIIYSRAKGILLARPGETKDEKVEVIDKIEELDQKPSLQISQIGSTEEYTSWKDGKLVFRSETLENLSRKIERFYNVNIFFEDDSIKEFALYRYS
jgi:transmembrane sensor